MRGLKYLILGRDIDGQVHGSVASSFINDARLKKDVETYSISLSARLIYNLLLMALSEQEGLLDEFLEERMTPGIVSVLQAFRTEGNASTAIQAMLLQGWTQKFFSASYMWGRHDAGDLAFAQQLRSASGVGSG
jgi:hypothetical protein